MSHRQEHHTTAAPFSTGVEWINIGLIALAVASLLYYVIAANSLAAQAWRSADAQDELTASLEERNSLVAQQSAFEDRAVLATLATEAGMVPAGAVVYVVQDQSVAQR